MHADHRESPEAAAEDVAEIIFELTDRIYTMQDEQFYDRMDTTNLDDNDDDGCLDTPNHVGVGKMSATEELPLSMDTQDGALS